MDLTATCLHIAFEKTVLIPVNILSLPSDAFIHCFE